MTREEFENWRTWWYRMVPHCFEFVCEHELTSCGVNYLCGDCTIYETWQHYRNTLTDKVTCTDINCGDCMLKHECEGRKNVT